MRVRLTRIKAISVWNMKTSSSVKTQVVVVVTLTQISLYVRVDKENSLESLLDCVHYLYMSDCLSLFTDPTILHN